MKKISLKIRVGFKAAIILVSGLLLLFNAISVCAESVTVGYANEDPFAYMNPNGELVGLDAETLKVVLGKMGITKIEAKLVDWGALIPGVKSKRFDIASSGIYMKPERCDQVAFSEPLYISTDGIIVLAGNPKKIHGFDAFVKDRSLKLANTIGATGPGDHALAAGVLPEQIVEVPDPPSQIAALKAGRVDGCLNTAIQTGKLIINTNDPDIERATPFQPPIVNGKPAIGIIGIAFNKNNSEFVKEFNRHLKEFTATPEYLKILNKYGLSKQDLPPEGLTAAKICSGNW